MTIGHLNATGEIRISNLLPLKWLSLQRIDKNPKPEEGKVMILIRIDDPGDFE